MLLCCFLCCFSFSLFLCASLELSSLSLGCAHCLCARRVAIWELCLSLCIEIGQSVNYSAAQTYAISHPGPWPGEWCFMKGWESRGERRSSVGKTRSIDDRHGSIYFLYSFSSLSTISTERNVYRWWWSVREVSPASTPPAHPTGLLPNTPCQNRVAMGGIIVVGRGSISFLGATSDIFLRFSSRVFPLLWWSLKSKFTTHQSLPRIPPWAEYLVRAPAKCRLAEVFLAKTSE